MQRQARRQAQPRHSDQANTDEAVRRPRVQQDGHAAYFRRR